MMLGGRNSRYPFTASQWQELEHQALIFKYMVAGSPVPPDLIIPIKKSCLSSSNSLYHQPDIGWGYQLGFGSRKGEDPEPGRCRRTDGKKWRCSKEAYPDSKYCERHMHRGKNRSRKPVEMPSSATATPTTTNNNNSNSFYSSASYSSHHLSNPKAVGIGHSSSQSSLTHFSMGRSGSSSDKDYRYLDQYSFLSDASGAERRDGSWRFTPLGTSSLGEPRQSNCTHFSTDLTKESRAEEQHCFVMGTDFKLGRSADVGRDCEDSQRPLRRFLGDWSSKSKEPWMDSEEDEEVNIPPPDRDRDSHTQLSISIPRHDFNIAKSHSSSSG